MMDSYIAFIDMVGIKDLSKYDPGGYYKKIKEYRSSLFACISEFKSYDDFSVYYYSDCAYLESLDLLKILSFMSMLRHELMLKNLYVKGAVCRGCLLANTDPTEKGIKDNLSKVAHGTVFLSEDISNVYGLQETLKGIGINVDPNIVDINEDIEEHFAKSFFLPDVNSKYVRPYIDIKIDINGMDDRVFDEIFQRYLEANIKQKKYGRMFLSLLANILYCIDLNSLTVDKNNSEDVRYWTLIQPHRVIDRLLFLHKYCSQLYINAKGIEYLYFYLLDRLYAIKKSPDDVTYYVTSKIISMKKIMNKFSHGFDDIPECVLSAKSKVLFISDYNKYHVSFWDKSAT